MTAHAVPEAVTATPVVRRAEGAESDYVVYLDAKSAKRILWCGEDLIEEKLPAGTRVVYPKPPLPGLPDRDAAIEYALHHPQNMDPLPALLRPGMRVTICIDDISLPLPMMQTPDMRQSVLTMVLKLLAEHGVEDVHIIVATSFHRRLTAREMRRCVGKTIFGQFYPDRYYNHDGEAPGGIVELGKTGHGEPVRINRRVAESDLVIYININLVPMDGGHKSVGVGLCDYATLRAHHTPQAILGSDSYMDPGRSALATSCNRIGRLLERHLKVFHIEAAINNRMFHPSMHFLEKNEDEFTELDRVKFLTMQKGLEVLPRAAKRKMLFSVPSPYEPVAVYAGEAEATHGKILEKCFEQYCIPVRGQSDVLITGIPFVSPYNVHSIMNPILVQVMALGYFFNFYRYQPLVKKGGVMIVTHPLYDEFDPEFHPSYIEFFNRLLPETRDSFVLQDKYEEEFAKDSGYISMYRYGHAYHGVHPFYMWYWGENGRAHVGKVIVVGAENDYVAPLLGWENAGSTSEALEMARSHVGHSPSVTLLHLAPILMTDVLDGEAATINL
ncbi:MAG: DUF2088 domain-containing protein [Acidobacteria bacterium]|nr:DUF2088 domain-containing protein [Acidobacteriota bacterium]